MSLNDSTHDDQQQPGPDWIAARKFFDNFESIHIPDKKRNYLPVSAKYDAAYLQALYSGSDIAEKCVDYPVNEAMREGVIFTDKSEEKLSFIDSYQIWQKIARAWKEARLSGGSALFINVDDGLDLSEPLDLKASYTFEGVVPVTRYKLRADSDSVIDDLSDPAFGLPERYSLVTRTNNVSIHRSRLVIFDGTYLPEDEFIGNGYWHQSILAKLDKVIKDFDICFTNISEIVRDANYFVFKIPNLKMTAAQTEDSKQYGDYIKSRIKRFNENRDRSGAVILDKDEELTMLNASLQGISDLLDRSKTRLQMAVRIPAPILFNESPGSSMSANGSSEQSFWYDHLAHMRKDVLEPRFNRILEVIANSTNKTPSTEDWEYNFIPLFQLSESEKLDNENKDAQIANILIQAGVLDQEEVRKYYAESQKWSRYISQQG